MSKKRDIVILDAKGNEKFRQDDVDTPEGWSDTSCSIFVSKYFYGKQNTSERETSIFQVIDRVVDRITDWGYDNNYFKNHEEREEFQFSLRKLLVNQKATFNSPVFFNINTPRKQFSSACFVLSIEDNIESIVNWWNDETFIFNSGSGAGINISNLRSKKERLSGGGWSSGPVSFMRGADTIASVIKSAGRVRRAAKLVAINDNHPDVGEFIQCKIDAERQLGILKEAGIIKGLDDDSAGVPFQSSNHSISISDKFMNAVSYDQEWPLYFVNSPGEISEVVSASELFDKMIDAIWQVGDPGAIFIDTVNKWSTVKNSGMIHVSNPCGEFLFLDNSACNLAVLKLTAFFDSKTQTFDIDSFCHAIDIIITAQDILIDNSDFPTDKIKQNSMDFRPLGLGYTDLGALLMKMGYSYDSDEGRYIAASIASLMTARAYTQSWRLAIKKGPFKHFEKNKECMKEVIRKHKDKAWSIRELSRYSYIIEEATSLWEDLVDDSVVFRNSQVSLMMPAGTTGLCLDSASLGIEPEFSLVRYKKMAGGGELKIVNDSIKETLESLGYNEYYIAIIEDHIKAGWSLETCGHIEEGHLPIFDCALSSVEGGRCLSPEAHIKMIAAIQPHVSSGISKTVNLPNDITREEIKKLTFMAWELGVKGLTFYRDGSKNYQPLTTTKDNQEKIEKKSLPVRRKLPSDCVSKRHKFRVGEIEGYLHCGLYEDGSLGEVFITISKEGSTIAGLMDTIATLTSLALQYGVPVDTLVNKFSYVRFEPSGFTDNPNIKTAKSIVDYVFRYLGENFHRNGKEVIVKVETEDIGNGIVIPKLTYSAPICPDCGEVMRRNGSCYVCDVCGSSSGCG